ncbi:hypothetical protein ACFQ08_19365 [Streptosporangium algeriense]|uniref:Uncharacterized protein n=1 Tax=Streptosporangium algeriense TaxID=1682748 RepID=A0ABW3DUH2_9ACTN
MRALSRYSREIRCASSGEGGRPLIAVPDVKLVLPADHHERYEHQDDDDGDRYDSDDDPDPYDGP